ncbi:uncharacterized protein STEHIDRAFT_73016 [Stereum hirsutum FP-91666 SS1]|uniref:uncharacterized protein n=1 Tax=Stereum hirsutum (strain FP-91666) TaxID=721885 RepID=UPI000440F164|nr:uncharacterized protein STEHIDRAFT_73016 [Stereum hirsutum FP-91666 SS1]EIM91227.1 hypothetical protein STEHIDRAFT_73016 [Stereum hirsutum FP-91666 SS1]
MVRFKNRWILVEFLPMSPTSTSDQDLTGQRIFNALRQSIISNFGSAGWGSVAASLSVKYFSPTTNLCIVRVARDPYRTAWAGVSMLSNIEGKVYLPNVIHVSGTIKHTQLAAIEHNRTIIARYRASSKTPTHPHMADSYEGYLEKSAMEISSLQD